MTTRPAIPGLRRATPDRRRRATSALHLVGRDDGVGERLRRLLRHVVPDAVEDAVRVRAGEHLAVGDTVLCWDRDPRRAPRRIRRASRPRRACPRTAWPSSQQPVELRRDDQCRCDTRDVVGIAFPMPGRPADHASARGRECRRCRTPHPSTAAGQPSSPAVKASRRSPSRGPAADSAAPATRWPGHRFPAPSATRPPTDCRQRSGLRHTTAAVPCHAPVQTPTGGRRRPVRRAQGTAYAVPLCNRY